MKKRVKILIALVAIPVALLFIPPALYCGYIVFEYYSSGEYQKQAHKDKLAQESMNRLPASH
jgi:hypothetical protein